MFPKKIKDIVKDLPYREDTSGRSGDNVYIFGDKFILKVSTNLDVLKREAEKMNWIACFGLCPKPILAFIENNHFYYLRGFLNGHSLVEDKYINNPDVLVNILVEAIQALRNLDDKNCPFDSVETKGASFVHGDLCLPNIYVDDNDHFLGFIDLDNSGLGDPWWDYAWVLWTLEYNLKTDKYNNILLEKIGVEYNKEKYELYTRIEE